MPSQSASAMFCAQARDNCGGIIPAERERFEKDGWIGPYPLLSAAGVDIICRSDERSRDSFISENLYSTIGREDAFCERPWSKSMHAHLAEFYAVASHPAIVSKVSSVIGPDVIVWGASVTTRQPGQVHRWHVDVEHDHWHGVTVFVGLENISLASTLKLITTSQRMGARPQQRGITEDHGALAACRAVDPSCALVAVDLKEGEFFAFHGRLWHASRNDSAYTRKALVIHYSRPDAEVAIPVTWDDPILWHSWKPPCILVAGEDRHRINRLVNPPLS